MDWSCDSSGWAPALEVQSSESNSNPTKNQTKPKQKNSKTLTMIKLEDKYLEVNYIIFSYLLQVWK
jgi:hypothetical protein